MPAILEDPLAKPVYMTSGAAAVLRGENHGSRAAITSRNVVLRDKSTIATVLPIESISQVPRGLVIFLHDVMNAEIEAGDTYCMLEPLSVDTFASYWFANFVGIMLLGDVTIEQLVELENQQIEWSQVCLGTFCIKPNYAGRSSHVCNGSFLVTPAARGKGVGRLMGEAYLDYAPKLGYIYSIFNLVYETNVASLRIWKGLGFEEVGRVKGCGHLKSYPDRLIDAIVIGRDLTQ